MGARRSKFYQFLVRCSHANQWLERTHAKVSRRLQGQAPRRRPPLSHTVIRRADCQY
jgi:hypothetical protein